jgi:hypothetical protein
MHAYALEAMKEYCKPGATVLVFLFFFVVYFITQHVGSGTWIFNSVSGRARIWKVVADHTKELLMILL